MTCTNSVPVPLPLFQPTSSLWESKSSRQGARGKLFVSLCTAAKLQGFRFPGLPFIFFNYIFFLKEKQSRKPVYIHEYTCEIMTFPLGRAYVLRRVQASCLALHGFGTIMIGIYIYNKLCCKHEHFNSYFAIQVRG